MEPPNYGGLEDDFPCKWVIFRFHVNFQGCKLIGILRMAGFL